MKPEKKRKAGRYRELRRFLSSARSRIWRRAFGQGLLRMAGLVGIVLVLSVLAVIVWPASWAGPIGTMVLIAAIVVALGLLFCLPLLRVPSVLPVSATSS
jgi:hypothetical protein